MPEGMVQWFDPTTGEGRIVHAGRRYAVRAEDMPPKARAPGARVHFDIARGQGDRAVNVSLRPGRRTSWRQRRFGALTGAHRPDAAGGGTPATGRDGQLGRDLERYPMRVAELWAALVAANDLDNIVQLYAPDAALHAAGEVHVGPRRIRRYWSSSPLMGRAPSDTVGEGDTTVVARWPDAPGGTSLASRMQIAHGEIAEQWIGSVVELQLALEAEETTPLVSSTAGNVSESDLAYAIDKISKVLETFEQPLTYAGVRLEQAADPARVRRSSARVTIDLPGGPVRAQVAAETMPEAVDLLEARLRSQFRSLSDQERVLRRRGFEHEPGEWRHGDAEERRAPYFPRPVPDREVVRRKTFSTVESTVDEAIFDMESMDHDFFLFTDLASGQDAIVWRDDDGYRLRYVDGLDEGVESPTAATVTVDPTLVPNMSLDDAREYLDVVNDPWVFFRDTGSGRGHTLYRRYDGHYGLITPVDEPD